MLLYNRLYIMSIVKVVAKRLYAPENYKQIIELKRRGKLKVIRHKINRELVQYVYDTLKSNSKITYLYLKPKSNTIVKIVDTVVNEVLIEQEIEDIDDKYRKICILEGQKIEIVGLFELYIEEWREV